MVRLVVGTCNVTCGVGLRVMGGYGDRALSLA